MQGTRHAARWASQAVGAPQATAHLVAQRRFDGQRSGQLRCARWLRAQLQATAAASAAAACPLPLLLRQALLVPAQLQLLLAPLVLQPLLRPRLQSRHVAAVDPGSGVPDGRRDTDAVEERVAGLALRGGSGSGQLGESRALGRLRLRLLLRRRLALLEACGAAAGAAAVPED